MALWGGIEEIISGSGAPADVRRAQRVVRAASSLHSRALDHSMEGDGKSALQVISWASKLLYI